METCDLLCIGSGPASMSAAINGASEGLSVTMIDGRDILGGQARESSAIENYPGFPDGITGENLMSNFIKQALKFKTNIQCPVTAIKLRREDDRIVVTTDDYNEYAAKAVLLGIGVSYRKLDVGHIAPLMGRGVYYGLPQILANNKKKTRAVVVGGANSAGQAVLRLSQNKNTHVTMIIRRRIVDQMSTYLIDRIKELPNCDVIEGETLTCLHGEHHLEGVTTNEGRHIPADCLYIFIGAQPKTVWLDGALQLDDRKFIRTWTDVVQHDELRGDAGMLPLRPTLPYETSMPGVFAAGDVRMGSTKRIASAIGEGAGALQMVHRYLTQ